MRLSERVVLMIIMLQEYMCCPAYQNQGCGSYIMNCLEKEISKVYDTVILDASLPAACLYEHRGDKTVGHGIYELENDVKLVYEIMERKN